MSSPLNSFWWGQVKEVRRFVRVKKPYPSLNKAQKYFFNIHLGYSLNDIVLIQLSPFRWGEYLYLAGVQWVKPGVPGVKPL